jgi:predicted outer membrane repeat protein
MKVYTIYSILISTACALVEAQQNAGVVGSFLPVNRTACNVGACSAVDSMRSVVTAVNTSFFGRQEFCLCPFRFEKSTDACTGLEVFETSVIAEGRVVRVSCAVEDNNACVMGCGNSVFEVDRGARLILDDISFTGGSIYPRVLINSGANLTGNNLRFFDTLSWAPASRARGLQVFNSSLRDYQGLPPRSLQLASGSGAGILSSGILSLYNTTFENCRATKTGGGLYTAGLTQLTGVQFLDNTAPKGGAFYVGGTGTVTVRDSVVVDPFQSDLMDLGSNRNSVEVEAGASIDCFGRIDGQALIDACNGIRQPTVVVDEEQGGNEDTKRSRYIIPLIIIGGILLGVLLIYWYRRRSRLRERQSDGADSEVSTFY